MKTQANGIQTNYELSGVEGAPMLIMSHSLACNLFMWDPQLPALESKYRILRYDTRGHGGSETSPEPYTLDLLGDDAIALMDALNIEQAHWIGLSMGGMIGQNLGLRHPGRLLSLSLCDTSAQIPADMQGAWQQRIETARNEGMDALAQSTLERWFTPAYLAGQPAPAKLIRQYILATPVSGFVGCCEAIRQLDYLQQLPQITLPTLIIVGAQDMGTPVAASEAINQRIAGSKLVVLDDAAHLSNVEQAEPFNRALLDFLPG